ncbi:MAG: aldehyde dehydrogenase [Salibacteraceae bacterium]
MSNFDILFKEQQAIFNSNVTKTIENRKKLLKQLLTAINQNEDKLVQASYKDLHKSKLETIATEISVVKAEISFSIKNIRNWAEKEYVTTNLVNIPASSYIIPEPLGTILIIGAWNYPIVLTLHPLVSAIAAGNTAIIKPSELAPHTSSVIAEIINSTFDKNLVHVIEGGISETSELLKLKFDKIFFTGSTSIGKIIYKAAAENLTPVTLELGGKSPAIITKTASIRIAAKRLVWGKFLNTGQTCVAPDYLLIDNSIKVKFIEELKEQITFIFGENAQESEAYGRIINLKNYHRLIDLIPSEKIIFGGEKDENDLYISPTLLDNISWQDEIMQDEIFGPILPIISYTNLDDAISEIKSRPKPLSLYVFTNSTKTKNKVLNEVSFGGGGINETVVHLGNHHLPFGGVGGSGMGNYHGKYGFDCFSHKKAIHDKPNWFEPNVKYPPFSDLKIKIIKWLLR